MKLRLPSILLSALVAAQMCTTANADTVVASGVSYDVGKASPFYSGTKTDLSEDYLHCWATSASNVLQNWQDKYSDNAVTTDLPNGTVAEPDGAATGTANLQVYRTILENSYGRQIGEDKKVHNLGGSNGGTSAEVFDWWFKNVSGGEGEVLSEVRTGEGSQYYTMFGDAATSTTITGAGYVYNDFTDKNLKDMFATSNGGGITLTIHQTGSTAPFSDELGEHTMGESRSHSITCWGYETDDEGNISAMFLSDSDDLSYGVFKVQAQHREGYDSLQDYQWQGMIPNVLSIHLDTDDTHDGYNGNFEVVIQQATAIVTPKTAQLNDGASTEAATAVDASGKVTENTALTKVEEVSGHGVVVGNAEAGKLVILSSDNDAGLRLVGNKANEAGLTVEKGSLASVEKLDVSGYNGSALDLDGRAYLHDGSVSITDNHATNGGAANTETYLEIEGNSKVTVSGNSATNKGGAIYNTGILSVFGNTSVEFSGNTASANGGQDIYNAKGGIVNIYNNDEVVFKSSAQGAAVRNEGELYIAAQEGHTVTFEGSSLDSRGGKTYIGVDLSGDATDSKGGATFTNEDGSKSTQILAASDTVTPHTPVKEDVGLVDPSFTHYEQRTPATLENVTVNVNEIAGTSAKASSVTGANIVSNGGLLVKSLTLDASDTIKTTSGDITMTNTVIKLKDFSHTTEGSQHTFDLSGLTAATGTLTLNNVVFDTTGMDLDIGADDTVLITFAPMVELTDAQLSKATGTNLRGELQGENAVIFHGNNLAPEPATATLSLLALAALAARRKRH